MKKIISTDSAAQTIALGRSIGRQLKGGEVIELVSDLGGGKTTFVHGLANGFGSKDKVASPTFTISKVYQAGHKEMIHFDFYRLNQVGLVAHELAEVLGDPNSVVVVEWGDIVQEVLPPQRLTITIRHLADDQRQLELSYPASWAYLVEGLQA